MGSPHRPHWQGNQPGGHWPPPVGRSPWSRKLWLWLLPLLVVVVATAVVVPLALTGDDEPAPRATPEGGGSSSTGVPEEELTPRPKDRDPEAVGVALLQLDPCKLLDLDVARQRGHPEAVAKPRGTSECVLVPSADYEPDHYTGLEVHRNVASGHLNRYGATPLVIGGARAYETSEVSDLSSGCRVVFPVSFRRGIEFEYELPQRTELCPTVRQYAEAAATMLWDPDSVSEVDPDEKVAPQRPLLYRPDENDTGAVGDCVDLGVTGALADCEPYHDVPVPTAPDDIMAAADANRNVQCAVFSEAVEAVFGKDFSPVTWTVHCFFVDPTHLFDIRVNVDPGNRPSDYGRGDLYTDRQVSKIAGMAAVSFWGADKGEFDIYLSPYDNLRRPGNLHIGLKAHGGRGKGMPDRDTTLTQEQADQATHVITQVVDTYFS